jgi:PAS domain S-box-containing protein
MGNGSDVLREARTGPPAESSVAAFQGAIDFPAERVYPLIIRSDLLMPRGSRWNKEETSVKETGPTGKRAVAGPQLPGERISPSVPEKGRGPSAVLFLSFAAVAAVIITIGYLSYRRYVRNFELEVSRELTSIADLKVSQIERWRKERLRDASHLDQNPMLPDLVRRSLQDPADPEARRFLRTWLEKYKAGGEYDQIRVLDRLGKAGLSVPEEIPPVSSAVVRRLPDLFQSGRPEILDFYKDDTESRAVLSLLIPIKNESPQPAVVGVLALRIDPEIFLYPFIQRWPRPSQTAETLIVRRDGDNMLYLNELRFQKNAALNLRIPLREKILAGQAIEGREGIVKGLDYRRKLVIGSLRRIPDSPWFLIARMDMDEVYAPVRARFLWNLGFIGALLIAAGLGLGTIQRRQRIRFLRERLETARNLHAASMRQEALLAALPEIIMEVDQNKFYVWANRHGLNFFGEDVIGKEAAFYFEGEQNTYRKVAPVFDGSEDVIYVESWQRRRDGQKRLLAWWCRTIKDPEGKVTGALSSARDITEERQAEEARRENEAKFRSIFENIQDVYYETALDGTIIEISPSILPLSDAQYSREDLLGKSILDFFANPEERSTFLTELSKQGQLTDYGIALRNRDGMPIPCSLSCKIFRDAGGRPEKIIGSIRNISERKKAEAQKEAALTALRENQAIFDQFMKNSPVYMFFKDENIRAIRLSANYKDMLGLPVEEALGKNMDELFPSDLAKSMIADDQRILREGKQVNIEEYLNGRFYATIKFPIRVEGKPPYLAGFTIDITERKKAEAQMKAALEALKTSEEKFRKAFITSPDAININRLSDGMFVSINRGFTQAMGYREEEIVGRTSLECNIWADAEDRRRLVERLRNAGEVENLEARFRRKNGELGIGLMSAVIIEIDRVPHILSITRDITERKQAETALRKSEAKFRNIFENIQDLYYETAPDGTILEVSPSINILSGKEYRREDLIGKSINDFYGVPEEREALLKIILEQGHVEDYEIKLRNRDGSLVPCSLSSKIVFDSHGRPEKIVGSMRNIAERKLAEDRTKTTLEALRVSLREKELLLQEIHHRVKNNMQIISSLFNLEAEHASPETREILKRGQTRIRSLSLVHERLYRAADLSRIDLSEYIQDLAIHLFQVYLVDPSQVRLETDFEKVSLDINSAIPCGLIINELISNALKHAFPDGRKGVVRIRLARAPGDSVELRVFDDGVGLPEGIDFRNPASFGFEIISLLVGQLEAEISLERKGGTTFILKFKELKYKPRI